MGRRDSARRIRAESYSRMFEALEKLETELIRGAKERKDDDQVEVDRQTHLC